MNSIIIDDLEADLAAGTSITLEKQNPHLLYGSILSTRYSLPGLPVTPRNRAVFGHYHLPQSSDLSGRFSLQHYYKGQLIHDGTFLLTEAGGGGYSGTLIDNYGEFFGDYQNRPLPELNLGTIAVPAPLTPAISVSGAPACAFPTILNADYYSTNGAAVSYGGRMNPYSSGSYQTGPKVPMLFLPYLLQRIAALTGVTISGSFLTHPVYSNLLVYNTRELEGSATITISQHLPSLTVAGLFIELRKLLNLRYDFDLTGKRLTIGFWEDALLPAAGLDWSGKAVGQPVKIPEPNRRLQLGSEQDSNDALLKDKPAETLDYLTAGSDPGVAEMKSRFSTLLADAATGTARTAQPGISSQFGQGSNTFSPRLLIWQGLSGGLPKAVPALGGYSLFWTGPSGLAANHWMHTEQMRSRMFYARQDLLLNETDLATLDFARKVHINGMDYLIVSVSGNLPITGPFQALLVRV